ncbi:MAG TPA: ComEC/Rec2 family competence protein [Anaerolineae bacterium]
MTFRAAPFVLITTAFAAGLWLASQFALPLWFCSVVALGAFVALVALALARQHEDLAWSVAFVMLAAIGATWYTLRATPVDETPSKYNGRFVVVEGVVDDEPDNRPEVAYLRLRVARMAVSGAVVQPNGIVLIRADHAIDWQYGDVARAFGVLDAPPVFADFDYRDYLARQNVGAWISNPDNLQRLGTDEGNPLYAALFRYKAALRLSALRIMPAPESALLNGILIGDANAIPASLQSAFRRTGTAHIVAISGFNVSIIVGLLVVVLGQFLSRRAVALVAMPVVLTYMVLVGLSGSVVRAALMAVIMLLGRMLWRRAFTVNTLFAAAFIIMCIDPAMLFDLSLQLSFAATLGIVLYSERLRDGVQALLLRRFRRETARAWTQLLADVLLTTVAATVTTMPILLATFHQLSLVALPANALVLPLQPPAMVLGLMAVVTGLFSTSAGAIAALPAYALLTITLRVVEWMAAPSWAALPVYGFGTLHVIASYLALGAVTAVFSMKIDLRQMLGKLVRKRLGVIGALVVIAIVLTLGGVWWYQQPDGKLHVTFTGKGAFVQTPAGKQIVFAGGGGVLPVMGRAMPVWDNDIDLLFLPRRSDAVRGDTLPILLRYRPEIILQPDDQDEPSAMLDEWSHQAAGQGAQVMTVTAGSRIELEPMVVLTVAQRVKYDIGLRLTYGAVDFELVGDTKAISGTIDNADVVFVSVHGAGADVINDAQPRNLVWADAGGAPPVLARSIRAFNLRDLNTIEFVSDGKTLWTR